MNRKWEEVMSSNVLPMLVLENLKQHVMKLEGKPSHNDAMDLLFIHTTCVVCMNFNQHIYKNISLKLVVTCINKKYATLLMFIENLYYIF